MTVEAASSRGRCGWQQWPSSPDGQARGRPWTARVPSDRVRCLAAREPVAAFGGRARRCRGRGGCDCEGASSLVHGTGGRGQSRRGDQGPSARPHSLVDRGRGGRVADLPPPPSAAPSLVHSQPVTAEVRAAGDGQGAEALVDGDVSRGSGGGDRQGAGTTSCTATGAEAGVAVTARLAVAFCVTPAAGTLLTLPMSKVPVTAGVSASRRTSVAWPCTGRRPWRSGPSACWSTSPHRVRRPRGCWCRRA